MNKIVFVFFTGFLLMIGASHLQADPLAEGGEERYSSSTYAAHVPNVPEEKAFARRAKGMHGLGLFGGIAPIGPIAGIEWSYQFLLSAQLKVFGGIEWKKQSYITYRSFYLQPMVCYPIFTNYHNFCVSIGMGAILTYIRKSDERFVLNQGTHRVTSNFNAGIVLVGEMELFVFKAFELTLGGGPILYLFKDPYDKVAYYLSLGLKLNF